MVAAQVMPVVGPYSNRARPLYPPSLASPLLTPQGSAPSCRVDHPKPAFTAPLSLPHSSQDTSVHLTLTPLKRLMLNNSASSAWVAWPTHLSAYFYLVLATALATLSQAVPLAANDVYPRLGARSNEDGNGNNDKNNENNKNKKSKKEENFFDKEYGGVSGKQIAIIVGVGSAAALIVGVAVWHRRKTNKEKAARRLEDKTYQYENEAPHGVWA